MERWKKRAQGDAVKVPKAVKADDGREAINVDLSKDPLGDPFMADKLVCLDGTIAW